MGREIKFRSWVENDLKGSIYPFMNYRIEFTGGAINDIFATSGQAPLNPLGNKITYMQYTGLNDKNGREIYEGDITLRNGIKYRITKEIGSFMLVKCNENTDMYEEFTDCWNDHVYPLSQLYWNNDDDENHLSDLEVIGNIYENPELLEV